MGKEGVVNENRTIEELERFRRLIADLDNESDFDDKMDVLIRLKKAINDAFEDKLISEQMYRDYQEVFDNHRRGMELHPQDLQEIVSRHLNQVGDVIDQMTKSITLDTNAVETQEEEDSEEYLQAIKDAMERYANAYAAGEHNGALSAVDKFSEIGDTIKKAVSENKLTHVTADELIGPLQEMKDNLFDKAKQNEAYDLFQQIITEKMSRQKENQNQNAEEKPDNTTGSVLGNIIDGVARGLSAINQKIEERAKAAADEHDEQQAQQSQTPSAPQESTLKKKQQNIDVYSEKPKDLMAREDKVQKKDPQTKEEALWKLKDLWSELNRARQDWVENQTVDRLKKSNDLWTKFHEALRNPLLEDFVQEYDSVKGPLVNGLKNYDVIQQKIDRAIQKAQSERHAAEQAELQNDVPQQGVKKDLFSGFNMGGNPYASASEKKTKKVVQEPIEVMQKEDNVHTDSQTKKDALLKLKDALAKRQANMWGWNGHTSSNIETDRETRKVYDDAFNNPLLHDFVLKYLEDPSISSGKGSGYRGYMLRQMIDKELAKESGNEINPKDQNSKIQALIDVLGMADYHDYDASVNRMKSALEKLVKDKVISPEMMHDYEDVFAKYNADNAGKNVSYLTMHDLEGLIEKQLYDLDSKSPKQEQKVERQSKQDNAKGKNPKTNDEIIDSLAGVLKHHNDRDPDSFRKMMFEIRDLSEKGMLPEDMKQEYRDVFARVKEMGQGGVRDGANRLNKTILGQIDDLEKQGKKKQELGKQKTEDKFAGFNMGASLRMMANEKRPTKADVSQRPADELKREDNTQEEKKNQTKERQNALTNFAKGNQKVQNMDNEREGKKEELNQAALAAYRRRVLEGRGTSNV